MIIKAGNGGKKKNANENLEEIVRKMDEKQENMNTVRNAKDKIC